MTKRTVSPRELVDKWRKAELKERSAAQEHFVDLCRMLGHPAAAEADPKGHGFTFEAGGTRSAERTICNRFMPTVVHRVEASNSLTTVALVD